MTVKQQKDPWGEETISIAPNYATRSVPASINEAIEGIRDGAFRDEILALRNEKDPDKQKKLKARLGVYYFGGLFDGEEPPKNDKLTHHSGVMVLDLDGKDNPAVTVEDMRNRCLADPHTVTAFVSPGGNGLKVIVKVSATDAISHTACFNAASDWYKSQLDLVVDKSGKDVRRACFVSYDFDAPMPSNDAIPFEPLRVVDAPKTAKSKQADAAKEGDYWESDPVTIVKARADLALIPPAIAGEHGDDMLFRAARKLAHGHALGRHDASRLLWEDYNPRCIPPWTIDRIHHKVDEALKNERDMPIGYAAPACKAVITWANTITPQATNWFWENRMVNGGITIVNGHPGGGKSFLTVDIAARVTTGRALPGEIKKTQQGQVLMLTCEDDPARIIVPRFLASGGMADKLALMSGIKEKGKDGIRPYTLDDVDMLIEAANAMTELRLIIIDPIMAFVGRRDTNKDNEVRAALTPISMYAQERNIAVIVISHTRKGAADRADDRISGSVGFAGLARSTYHVVKDKDNKDRILFLPGKNNYGPKQKGLAYAIKPTSVQISPAETIGSARIEWEPEPIDTDTDAAVCGGNSGPGRPSNKRQGAAGFLRALLSDNPGMDTAEIIKSAKDAGITRMTAKRALQDLAAAKEIAVAERLGNEHWSLTKDKE